MKHEMALFHTMGPNRNALFQIHVLFVNIHGLVWSSSVKLSNKMMLVYLKVPYYHAPYFS